jgi:hypothetical protein
MRASKNRYILPLNVVIESDGLNVGEIVSHLDLDMIRLVYY